MVDKKECYAFIHIIWSLIQKLFFFSQNSFQNSFSKCYLAIIDIEEDWLYSKVLYKIQLR